MSFAALKGAPLDHAKKTWNGQMERRRLLAEARIVIPDILPASVAGAPPDDVLDAAVLAWTARRVHSCDARSLPDQSSPSPGHTIWY